MRKQGNISAMACYAYVLLYIVGAMCIYGLASYIFDLGRLHDNMEIAVPFIWAGFTVICLRHYVRILVKEWVRTIAYFVLLIALAVPLLGIQRYMHTLKSPTVYVTSIKDAISKDSENISVDGEVKVDFANYGIYRTYQRKHHRHSSGIVFETYVVHPIAGAKNAYYGYCLSSKEENCTFSSEKQITSAEQKFYKSLKDSIAERTKETHSGYYHRVADNSDDFENYRKAYETCLGNPDNTQTPIFFKNTKMSEEESAIRMLQSLFEAFLIALAVFTVIFVFGKKNTKNINQIEKEEKDDRHAFLNYLKVKENWYTVSLVATLIIYYIISLVFESTGNINPAINNELLSFGGLSRYTFWDKGEVWRIITYAFVHGSFWHLSGNITGIIIFAAFNPWFSKSWRMPLTFFVSSIISGLVCIITYNPNTVLVGASAGVMGLFGLKVGMIAQDKWNEWRNGARPAKRKAKSKKAAVQRTLSPMERMKARFRSALVSTMRFLGIDVTIVVLPTMIYSFIPGVSMTGHLVGLLTGVVMWFIISSDMEEDEKTIK